MPQGLEIAPRRGELIAILTAGALHVGIEAVASLSTSRVYNLVAALLFAAYVGARLRREDVRRAWGFRTDNLGAAVRIQVGLVLAGVAALGILALLGEREGTASVRLFPLYLVWAFAQQFALQNLLARNLAALVPGPVSTALIAAGLFALVHAPRWELCALTFPVGFALVLAYRREPNLCVTAASHAVLGLVAFAWVLPA